jgi:hypothetical protein
MGLRSVLDEEWRLLTSFLPSDWRDLARSRGAIRRQRGVNDPDALLRLLLLHVASGLSLRQAVARATILGWSSMSDVALLKRLRSSESWLGELASKMYWASRFAERRSSIPTKRRIRAVDATTVEEPGATGTDWRVHYSILLPEIRCDFYEVTDVTGGESYKRFPVEQGDIILGDRGYSHREGAAHVIRAGGDVVVRLNSSSFPLLEQSGKPFDLLSHLRRLKGHVPGEWGVLFELGDERFAARLCAIRKSKTAAEAAKKRATHEASRKGKQVRLETLDCAEYVFVLTSVVKEDLTTIDVLDLYRLRWQIELVFKRLKSLLRLGHVPKKNDLSARAWIQAKLLTALIIERLSSEACFFSPWGFDIRTTALSVA